MPRQPPQIRDATPEDAAELLELWAFASHAWVRPPRAAEEAERALVIIAADPDERLLVAEVAGRVVAAMKLRRGPISPLFLDPAVHTSHLLVLPQFRRHGYAHALMDAALTWADEKDISQATAITDSNRENNRFFARLGLITVGTVRYSSVAGLRKKLTSERSRAGGGNRHLVEVLAQRRSLRRRQAAD